MYPEDVFINNHTTVWGSWWRDFKWGYACCHSTIKNSYCVGEDGLRAADESEALRLPAPPVHVEERAKPRESAEESRKQLEELKSGVSEVELEQYRKDRALRNDPMASLLGKDELIGAVK